MYTVPLYNREGKVVLCISFTLHFPLPRRSPVTILPLLLYISLSLILSLSIARPLLAPNNERISVGLRSRHRRNEYDLLSL